MFENLRQLVTNLNRNAKFGLAISLVAILGLGVWLAYWSFSPQYKALFSDLQLRDSAAIVGELDRLKVPYRLADGGRRILVPQEDVYPTRLKLMGKGVPLSGGVGFEIFDKNDFGMTEFAQRINYQRALQGELGRTIMSIQGVKYARVQLVLPQTSLFKESKTKPKASVGLILADGRNLSGRQIAGVQRLVAAAVPRLTPARVTIVDQHGMTLSRTANGEEFGTTATGKLDVKKRIEGYLEHKITAVLDRTFGKGKAIVSVDATLDMDKIHTTEESMIPLSHTKSGKAIGGLIRRRTVVNRSSPVMLADADGKSHVRRGDGGARNTTSEVEYKFGRKVEHVVSTPGNVRHLSVGVLVPYHMDADHLAEIRRLVAVTVGIDKARGDEVAVYPVDRYAKTVGIGGAAARQVTPSEPKPKNAQAKAGDTAQGQVDASATKPAGLAPSLMDMSTWREHLKRLGQQLANPYGYILVAVGGGFLLLFGALVASVLRPRRADPGRRDAVELTEAEREELLQQIQEWIQSDTPEAGNGVAV